MMQVDQTLSTLSRADAGRLKAFAETLLPQLEDIEVLQNRSGLVMVPMRDTAQGTAFHLGEVLVSEAHIRSGTKDGYGMRKGHDLEAAMAMAVVDLAQTLGVERTACETFCQAEAEVQQQEDQDQLRRIEATRVSMETF